MTNDAIATIAIVILVVLNVWQWFRHEDEAQRIEALLTIINVYRDKSGDVWSGMDEVETEVTDGR